MIETRDEDGNLVHGDLPQVLGDTLMWPIIPTEQQLNSSRRGGRCSSRMVMEEAGGEGKVITHRALYKVWREWEEPLVMRDIPRVSTTFDLEEKLPVVPEEEEEPVVGPLELCLAMLVVAKKEREG